MSSVPPNTPPGGGAPPPFPPYDPKTQWRVYREQQRAAWRAQRDAWKAQRYAWKAGYVGAYGPRVPSIVGPVILICVGVVALLLLTGHIAAGEFWAWYGRWWPLLLIAAGLGLLGEWALDLRRETPVRRSGSFVGIIILLALLGFAAAGWHHMGPWFNQWNNNNDDFFNVFGLPEHDNDQQLANASVPANAIINIDNPRGDVSISGGDGPNVEVQAHEVAFADSDADAKKIFEAEQPRVLPAGNTVMIKSQSNNSGRVNLTVTVPKNAWVTVNAGKGDVTAAGLGAGISVTAAHGDTHLNAIIGSVQIHFSNGRHDFSAHQIDGDLTANGDCNDLTLSEIKGRVSMNGQIFGEVHVEEISGPVSVHTSITDVQIAELPGDLTFDSDNLRINESKGLVHVVTHAKDIDLSQIYGDSYVEDRDGRISVEPAGPYSVEAKNSKGDVELTLPPNASASVNVRTHNGEIVSDYPVPSSGDGENKVATFTVGSGGSRIALSTDNGDVRIKKGPAFPPAPVVPNVQAAPSTPAPPNARHLKAPKALPPQPVTQ
jgi:DUF4097 and DUF4098 domain-containing protein YvlB